MTDDSIIGLCEQAAEIWRNSRFPVALTGAGISVASGIPDFRSPDGLWVKYDPSRVATITALYKNPREVWEFIHEAVLVFTEARPNPAHLALARLEEHGLLKAVITQNIDNLHQQAGSKNVIEYHGNCRRFYCMGCRMEYPPGEAGKLARENLPWTCAECGGTIRPDFVFFGEQIPPYAHSESMRLAKQADLALIVGTSGEVAPANTLPYYIKRAGGHVIEINLGPTAYGGISDIKIDVPAEEALSVLADMLIQSPS